jgi:tetratricopeptide (TPR) repeat protein
MRARTAVLIAIGITFAVAASAGEPMFVRWLIADDPGDQVIDDYWERAQRGELEPAALVDLGTMIFYRGFPKDAIEVYRQALDADPEFYEAWFLIGLVEHSRGELDNASQAYRRCLKQRPGHGWCNFYAGLLEEQLGHSGRALELYERAFKHAPELANPRVNPEVLSSDLVLGARLVTIDHITFHNNLPMRYLQPNKVNSLRERYEQGEVGEAPSTYEQGPAAEAEPATPPSGPQPSETSEPAEQPAPEQAPPPRRVPTREPSPTPSAESSKGNELPYGTPPIGPASAEARVQPVSDLLFRMADAVVSLRARR